MVCKKRGSAFVAVTYRLYLGKSHCNSSMFTDLYMLSTIYFYAKKMLDSALLTSFLSSSHKSIISKVILFSLLYYTCQSYNLQYIIFVLLKIYNLSDICYGGKTFKRNVIDIVVVFGKMIHS